MADEKKAIIAEKKANAIKVKVPDHLKVDLSYKKNDTFEIADDTYIRVSTRLMSGSMDAYFETCLLLESSDPDVRTGHNHIVKEYDVMTTVSELDKWHALFCSFVPHHVANFKAYENLELGDKP